MHPYFEQKVYDNQPRNKTIMKYIDAEKLKSEIQSLIDLGYDKLQGNLYHVISIVNSLQQEQSEVDLEEEMDRFFEEMSIQEHENIFEDTYQMIARHFYELGKNSK